MNGPPVPTYWTDDRKELRAWFARNAPSLGELYQGALRILFSETPFPGRVRFVSHAVREIRNRLPDVIAGPKQSQLLQYKNRMNELCKKWEKANLPTDGSLPISLSKENEVPKTTDVTIPIHVYMEIARLVRDHIRSRETPRDAAKRLYEAIDPNNQMAEAILRPRINHWIEVTEWFVNRVHDNGSTDDQIDLEEFNNRFEVFERALLAMVRGFFETVEELDEILEEANA
jgi:hypothetical protein